MTAPRFVFEVRPYDDPDVTRLVAQVQAEYVQMYGGPDAAAVELDQFSAPGGLLVVGVLDGEPVATGGWRRHGDPVLAEAEIKRMYVAPQARRLGLARRMLAELERTAAAAGVSRLVLNTGSIQQPAIALYRGAGYVPSAAFGHYAESPGAVFLGKDLRPPGA